ncbi:hypothetical protein A3I34_02820 [Candidatus Jorgensenbacteria bacterium RIFCSPLOWO2_02_FULL_45_12]|uniref:Putative 3-methyladenine DNA glycosylase n=1 Tax=Candidatus Jorgensenbacteria bacterium RIFCSPHIGHO2_02_FULL_45_20 TaxID=1798470 RepID=A0A1F6BQS9_9BACT|nr:MAG: hypothetical protein A3D55_00210 [Candidatus Jorgensenbacteria bacterium RIFCSPHIGHO2_02_FULL_45_20]OGG42284.1 MAG: hypothetical protein A3I34_02820 [Candidatus Jorgensenbacteria bacterium RIFCSPLOWO2_02_FULL_45_12]
MKRGCKLSESFFNRDTLVVAKELLGKTLARKICGKEIRAIITETEAYDGLKDKASHASRGKTARNEPMFGRSGRWYVYFTYGMHWMLNVVTREAGYPAAVLIRGVVCEDGQNLDGPAKLTKFLKINKAMNGKAAVPASGLWVEDDGLKIGDRHIIKSPRVGVDYAGRAWAWKRWNFRLNRHGFIPKL